MTMAGDRADEIAASPKFRQRYGKSQVIFEEGSIGSEMYLIHSGRVLLSVRRNEADNSRSSHLVSCPLVVKDYETWTNDCLLTELHHEGEAGKSPCADQG